VAGGAGGGVRVWGSRRSAVVGCAHNGTQIADRLGARRFTCG